MNHSDQLIAWIKANPSAVGRVVDYNPATDRLYTFDFTSANTELDVDTISDSARFNEWINRRLEDTNSRYGVGGYMEHRTLYARSPLFDTDGEPRRLHLGIDIWAQGGAPVYSPLDGIVHSFHDNDSFGDYGPTIILQHNLDGLILYSLYGHLSRVSLDGLATGQTIAKNQHIAKLGNVKENGHWPPHLHFQLMFDMEGWVGDYPGVARFSEKEKYLQTIPDPNLILKFPIKNG